MMRSTVAPPKRKKRTSLVLLVRAVRWSARVLPERCAPVLGRAFGRAAYALLPRERGRALQHLAEVFRDHGPAWIERTARQTFVHLGTSLFELLAARRERIGSLVTVNGAENLRKALSLGKGVIYVTGHIGNWELMGAAVGRIHPLSVIAAPLKPEPLNDLIIALRGALGVRTIVRGRPGAAKELIRVFRENRILGILIDQDTDVEGTFVEFFGRPAWTPTAAVQMAVRFDAPIVFGFIRRDEDGTHTVTIEGPIVLDRAADDAGTITMNTAMLTYRLETTIRKDPAQWVWMHRRWRRQP